MQPDQRSQREKDIQSATSTAEQPNPVHENIQTVTDLQQRLEEQVSPQQRAIERVTGWLGRPRFLFLTLLITTIWILVNIILVELHVPAFDAPPFVWLQGLLTLAA